MVAAEVPDQESPPTMSTVLSREVRFLKIYSVIATAILSVFLFSAAISQDQRQVFKEIDVERINIVEADGKLRMVISNQARQHPGIMDGKVLERSSPRPPGMIFFNHLGDEMGGLVFGENGGDGHFGSLTFDKVRNDQTIGFRHLESDNGKYHIGLEMWQQPDISGLTMNEQVEAARAKADPAEREAALQALVDQGQLTSRRLFLGKSRDEVSMLALYDIKGNARIRLRVDADGTARLEFLDEEGQVVHSIPE